MHCYVVGDIHGCPDELACLLEALPLEPADRLVFLGDYIDRGPDSKGVISYLIEWQRKGKQEIVFLKGNHEDMFLSYLGLAGRYGEMFLFNGGGRIDRYQRWAHLYRLYRAAKVVGGLPWRDTTVGLEAQPAYWTNALLCFERAEGKAEEMRAKVAQAKADAQAQARRWY